MSNATLTAIVLSIPLGLLAIAPVGILKSRLVFILLGVFLILGGAVLMVAVGFVSQLAAGTGSGGSGGWVGWWPMPLWFGLGFLLLVAGTIGRPKVTEYDVIEPEPEKKLPTLREVADRKRTESGENPPPE